MKTRLCHERQAGAYTANGTVEQQLFHIAVAETEAEVQPNAMGDDPSWEAVVLVSMSQWCAHEASIAHRARATQVTQQVDNAVTRAVGQRISPQLTPLLPRRL